MDKFTAKIALLVSLGGCLLFCIVFLFKFYIPNQNAVDKNTAKIKEIRQKIREESAYVSKLKEEINSFGAHPIHLNYFNRLQQQESERIPALLKILTNEANALGIKFISVGPQPPQDKNFYEKYSFLVEIWAAKYHQLFHFLDCIQNKLHLNIDELTIQSENDTSRHLRTKISLNTLEMRDNQLKGFENIRQMKHFFLDPNKKENSPSELTRKQAHLLSGALKRNPFRCSPVPTTPRSGTGRRTLVVKKNDKELVLSAIMNFQGDRIAILGGDQVKKGEIIKNTRVGNQKVNLKVLQIKEDSVTLGDGENKYIFKLPDNPITFK